MKKTVILSLICLLIVSCIREHTGTGIYKITNNSTKNLKIDFFYRGKLNDTKFISPSSFEEYQKSDIGNVPTPPSLNADSAVVTFNDSIVAIHTYLPQSSTKRSLFISDLWNEKKLKETKRSVTYEYEFVFTDEDYQKALDNV